MEGKRKESWKRKSRRRTGRTVNVEGVKERERNDLRKKRNKDLQSGAHTEEGRRKKSWKRKARTGRGVLKGKK